MVAYNFQAQFAKAVETGKKCRTIRARGKRRHALTGELIQLYTGMRTKQCRKLGEAVCTVSTYCAIREDGITTGNFPPTDLDEFAVADGFQDFDHMKEWFRKTHGLPFIGQLIEWINL
jgi:hypothetical protein